PVLSGGFTRTGPRGEQRFRPEAAVGEAVAQEPGISRAARQGHGYHAESHAGHGVPAPAPGRLAARVEGAERRPSLEPRSRRRDEDVRPRRGPDLDRRRPFARREEPG